MGAALDDAAIAEDEDEVGLADGAEAVGDDEAGAAAQEQGEGGLEAGFGDGVDGAGGFVEDEDARVGEEGAGEANELALAEGESVAGFADLGVPAIGKGLEEVEAIEFAGGVDDFGEGGFRAGETDVIEDGAFEEEVGLLDDAEVLVEAGGGDRKISRPSTSRVPEVGR